MFTTGRDLLKTRLWVTGMVVLAMILTTLTGPATAEDTIEKRLERARATLEEADRTVEAAEERYALLSARYEASRRELDAAVRAVVEAYRREAVIDAQLFAARDTLNKRASAVYQNGPGLALEVFLGSSSTADFASAQEFAARTLVVDAGMVDRVERLRVVLRAATSDLESRQARLMGLNEKLDLLGRQMEAELSRAEAAAGRAGRNVASLKEDLRRKLQEQRRRLEEARAADLAAIERLVTGQRGVDQRDLLSLLGPAGGRGCEIPSGLGLTSVALSGMSSWYGADFAGRPTASGAIYDPRLFTAANKELPLNTFLRVRRGARCAIVLVNDRGPYVSGRFLDLSQAAAEYLGVGVSFVTADVLEVR